MSLVDMLFVAHTRRRDRLLRSNRPSPSRPNDADRELKRKVAVFKPILPGFDQLYLAKSVLGT